MKYRTGICIDVFVVDAVPDNRILRKLHYGSCFCIRKVLYSELGQTVEKNPVLRSWYRLLYRIPRDTVFAIRNRIAGFCNRRRTQLMSHMTFPYPNEETKYGMPTECYESYTELEFEGMMFSALAEYDRYLTLLYHDYMTPPPVDKRCGPGEPSGIRLIDITLEEIQESYRRNNHA